MVTIGEVFCPTCKQKLTCYTCANFWIKTKRYKNPQKGNKVTLLCKQGKKLIVITKYIEPPGTGMVIDCGCFNHTALVNHSKEHKP
jgi:hypothetical protein